MRPSITRCSIRNRKPGYYYWVENIEAVLDWMDKNGK
jgi:hypothetical protein